MKASNFVFCIDQTEDGANCFYITSAKYFKKNGCVAYGDEDDDVYELLPDNFIISMEGMWEYDGDWRDGKEELLSAGFVYSDELHKFINDGNAAYG